MVLRTMLFSIVFLSGFQLNVQAQDQTAISTQHDYLTDMPSDAFPILDPNHFNATGLIQLMGYGTVESTKKDNIEWLHIYDVDRVHQALAFLSVINNQSHLIIEFKSAEPKPEIKKLISLITLLLDGEPKVEYSTTLYQTYPNIDHN